MLLFLAATGVHAQQTDNLQAAREAMARYEYSKAIELLDKALEAAAGSVPAESTLPEKDTPLRRRSRNARFCDEARNAGRGSGG